MSNERDRRAALRNPRIRRTDRSPKLNRYRVGPASALKPGESMKFIMPIRGIDEECFLINYRGRFHAYVNRCRHVPMAMDWVENQFFAEHGRYIMCQTHNAYYEPESGECIAGPNAACGKFLYRVPLEIRDEVIYARPLEDEFED